MTEDQAESTGRPYTAPTRGASAFHCPHCGAYAAQYWYQDLRAHAEIEIQIKARHPSLGKVKVPSDHVLEGFTVSRCTHCQEMALWKGDRLVSPCGALTAQPAPVDLPSSCGDDYGEARRVVQESPRSAAALLRLVLQKVLAHLLEKKVKDMNSAIAELVKQGLRPTIQQAMDTLRVTGNEAVHPGVMDLRDDIPTALGLFKMAHVIVHDRITVPREVEEAYASLPESKREHIEKRDEGPNE